MDNEQGAPEATPRPSEVGEHISAPVDRKAYAETYQDVVGSWRYRIVGANGEIVAASEGYASKANARRGFKDLVRIVNEIDAEDA